MGAIEMSLDAAHNASQRSQLALERALAARRRSAEVLAVSAGLAERHAEQAEARGDLERAEHEREVARRVRAALTRHHL
jgi:hypothetical protein